MKTTIRSTTHRIITWWEPTVTGFTVKHVTVQHRKIKSCSESHPLAVGGSENRLLFHGYWSSATCSAVGARGSERGPCQSSTNSRNVNTKTLLLSMRVIQCHDVHHYIAQCASLNVGFSSMMSLYSSSASSSVVTSLAADMSPLSPRPLCSTITL